MSAIRAAVVIPVFNNEAAVVGVVARTAALDLPVLVVDDGSRDRTPSALERWCRENPDARVEVITHPVNAGKAAALRTGFARASELGATHGVSIDADGQLDPDDIPLLLREAAAYPTALIVGRRPDRMSGCPPRCVVGRRYTSLAVLSQTGVRLSDTQCGLRVYPLEALERVRCRATRYAFEAEIITRMVWAGYAVREVPVRCQYFTGDDRVSHWKPWRDSSRQVGLHLRLLGLALIPTRDRQRTSKGRSMRSRLKDLLAWLNPLRSWRQVREGSIGDLELAFGLAIGAWIGSLPFYGLHTIMSVYVAWRLHQQPAAVVLGSQVSMPPFGVLLAAASMFLGHLMLTGSVHYADLAGITWENAWRIPAQGFTEWLLGSMVLGPIVAVVAFLVGLWVARRARSNAQIPGIR